MWTYEQMKPYKGTQVTVKNVDDYLHMFDIIKDSEDCYLVPECSVTYRIPCSAGRTEVKLDLFAEFFTVILFERPVILITDTLVMGRDNHQTVGFSRHCRLFLLFRAQKKRQNQQTAQQQYTDK